MSKLRSRVGSMFVSAILALSALAAFGGPAAALNGFTWDSGWGALGGWVDNKCGTQDEFFRIAINTKADGSGSKAKICHAIDDLRNVPRGSAGTSDFDNVISGFYFYNAASWYLYYLTSFAGHSLSCTQGQCGIALDIDNFFGDGWVSVDEVYPDGDENGDGLDGRISAIDGH